MSAKSPIKGQVSLYKVSIGSMLDEIPMGMSTNVALYQDEVGGSFLAVAAKGASADHLFEVFQQAQKGEKGPDWQAVAHEAMSALTDLLEAPERPTKGKVNGAFWRFRDAFDKAEKGETRA